MTKKRKKHWSRIIGIVSGKGGVGKTTFSSNLAIALTALGKKVVVIDCNVSTPHLSYYMGVKNYSSTINNIFSGELNPMFAPLDKNGVLFIPASEKLEDMKKVDMKDLRRVIIDLARNRKFDFIILDSAPGLGEEAIGVLKACNEIIYITAPTIPNMADISRCDEVAKMLGHRRFSLVLNMVRNKDFEITPDKAKEMFRMPVLGCIQFDESVMDSTAQGVPMLWYKPKSKTCDSLLYIAARVAKVDIGIEEPEEADDSEIVPITKRRGKLTFGNKLRKKIDSTTSQFAGRLKNAVTGKK